jgi:hypothetical protein
MYVSSMFHFLIHAFNIWRKWLTRNEDYIVKLVQQIKPQMGKLRALVRNLNRPGVKNAFALHGDIDYTMISLLEKLSIRASRFPPNQFDRGVIRENVQRHGPFTIIRWFLKDRKQFRVKEAIPDLLSRAVADNAGSLAYRRDKIPGVWDDFVELMNNEEFFNMMTPSVQKLVTKIRQRLQSEKSGFNT